MPSVLSLLGRHAVGTPSLSVFSHLPQPEKEPLGSEMTAPVLFSCGRLYIYKTEELHYLYFGGLILQNPHPHLWGGFLFIRVAVGGRGNRLYLENR